MTIHCPACRHENPPQAKFCLECGTRVLLSCLKCRAELPPSAKFCLECGERVTPLSVATAARFSSPESYTPKYLAERILTSRAALEGERKQVTVLFADLKGSMELLADRDPEEARKVLDPVLELMMEAVHRYEGTVNQVMGDGIMALFGAPLAHEDHGVRACYAALRMQEAVKRYADSVRRVEGIPIRIRVGLNSGAVVVRAIGSDLHMDYTAVGQTTHLAARMEQIAAPETIALTPATLSLAEGFVEVRSLGPMTVKGLAEPVDVYELTAASAARSRLHAMAARGLTKFVGRTSEMAQLYEALDLARGGRGQVVAIVGEPGVGKSRLLWEFTHSPRTDACLIVEAASVSYGKASAYFPIIELLKSYFAIEPRDDARKIREKVAGKLLSLDRAVEPLLPVLLALLEVPAEDEQWRRLDPPQRRQRTLDCLKRLLLRESQRQPLVAVFEDLHWIDSETQALLDMLVESLPTARLLLLMNYRPEYQHQWGSKTYYRQLRLDPLTSVIADELLDELLGSEPDVEPLKRLLMERTEGNPFFIEESVRGLVETGALTGNRGSYQLVRPVEGLRIPPTAHAVLAARIDRLESDDKRLLQAAAVIGKDVPLSLLQAVADEPDHELRVGLGRLQAAEFLYEARLFPELAYTFKHALTHEVAYGAVLHERRTALHRRVVETIEHLYADRLGEHTERLAHHASSGELWEPAARHHYGVATKLLDRSVYQEAFWHLDEALSALAKLDADHELALGVDIRLALRRARYALGHTTEALEHAYAAQALAERLGDQARLGRVYAALAHQFWLAGGSVDVERFAHRAIAVGTALNDREAAVSGHYYLGIMYAFQGRFADSDRHLELLLELIGDDVGWAPMSINNAPAVAARAIQGCTRCARGDFLGGLALGREAVRLAESIDRPFQVVWCLGWLTASFLFQGAFAEVIEQAERGLLLGKQIGMPFMSPFFLAYGGVAHAFSGRISEGRGMTLEATTRQLAMGNTFAASNIFACAADVSMVAGMWDEAQSQAEEAIRLARQTQERWGESWARRSLGEIRYGVGDVDSAEDELRQALVFAEDIGERPTIALCHAGLAKIYRHIGKSQEADEHFATAATMYRGMGMTSWLEKLENDRAAFG